MLVKPNEIEDILRHGSVNDEAASEAESEEEPSALVSKNLCATSERLGSSDHASIEFKVKLKCTKSKYGARMVYNYRKADWFGLKEDFGMAHGIVFIFPVTLMKIGMHGKHSF